LRRRRPRRSPPAAGASDSAESIYLSKIPPTAPPPPFAPAKVRRNPRPPNSRGAGSPIESRAPRAYVFFSQARLGPTIAVIRLSLPCGGSSSTLGHGPPASQSGHFPYPPSGLRRCAAKRLRPCGKRTFEPTPCPWLRGTRRAPALPLTSMSWSPVLVRTRISLTCTWWASPASRPAHSLLVLELAEFHDFADGWPLVRGHFPRGPGPRLAGPPSRAAFPPWASTPSNRHLGVDHPDRLDPDLLLPSQCALSAGASIPDRLRSWDAMARPPRVTWVLMPFFRQGRTRPRLRARLVPNIKTGSRPAAGRPVVPEVNSVF